MNQLAEPFKMTLPGISKHLKVLERAGLITRGRNAQWRPCTLDAAPLKEVADWTERYRRFYEESFERLDEILEKLQRDETQLPLSEQIPGPPAGVLAAPQNEEAQKPQGEKSKGDSQ